jgi:hypothetical protein
MASVMLQRVRTFLYTRNAEERLFREGYMAAEINCTGN